MEQRPSLPPSKCTAQIRSLTPEPRTPTSQGNPHCLVPPGEAIAGVRPLPPKAAAHCTAGREAPKSARRSPQAPTGLERPPTGDRGLRPGRHTPTGKGRSPSDSASASQSPRRPWANPEPRPQGGGGQARAWGRGLEPGAPVYACAQGGHFSRFVSVLARRQQLAQVGGREVAISAKFGNLAGGHKSRHTFVDGAGESE